MKTLCALCVAMAGSPAAAQSGYLVRDVAVVDVEAGVVRPGRNVTVVGDRIRGVSPAAVVSPPEGVEVIDGSGLYLMPGLFDAHVHLAAGGNAFGPLLIANGVTCVRDTGAPTQAILALREQARSGDALLPRIICTGAIIDGDPPVWPFSIPCDEPDEARAAVRELAAAGVDQVKVYSLLKPEVYVAAIDEAHKLGLKATGHVPMAVTLDEAIAAGQDCSEHLTGFDEAIGTMAGWTPPNPDDPWSGFAAWASYPEVPAKDLEAFVARVAASGMHQCPTIVVMQGIGRAADPDEADKDPRMAYVPASLRSFWSGPGYGAMAESAGTAAKHMQALVGELHRAGVPVMIGTDLANPYVFAGFSVHDEMTLFQEAGISAADVLKAATVVPARFCGVADTLGTVDAGKIASLVLVRGNPLDDVRNAAEVEAVFVEGRYFDRDTLDGLMENVAAANTPSAKPDTVQLKLPGEQIARGTYRSKFQEFDAGTEDFLVTRDGDGYHLMAHSKPTGGPMPPFILTYHASADGVFREATYKVLAGDPVVATYTVADGVITAKARRGDEELPVQTIEFDDDMLITAPATVTDFATLAAADLDVGESRTFRATGFGFNGWQLSVTDYTLTRREATHYTYTLATPMGDFTGEIRTDAKGVVVSSAMKMPMGTITVLRDDPPVTPDDDEW